MEASATIFSAIFDGNGRVNRYGEFSIITFQGGAIVATAMESHQILIWARTQISRGAGNRDVTALLNRFENLLARNGSGVATRGSRVVLAGIVKSMKASGLPMNDWSVPANLEDSVAIAKPKPAALKPAA